MRLVPGKLYRIKNDLWVYTKIGKKSLIDDEFIQIKKDTILLFLRKGVNVKPTINYYAHISYSFLFNKKVIEFRKRHSVLIQDFFEEIKL